MSQQILWFEKNKIDLEFQDISINITDPSATSDGQQFANLVRDRKNYTAWMTTGSLDANLTVFDISLVDPKVITDIILVGHNLKDYTIQFKIFAGAYQDFSTVINPNNDSEEVSHYNFDGVSPTDIRIIINGTQVANEDKKIKQLIITNRLGQFVGWPQIKKPTINTNKRKTRMLSGKTRIIESLESFSCSLSVKAWAIQSDLSLVETIYFKREGVLMWINANDAAQFLLDLKGYRKNDIFLVRPTDDWSPELISGVYRNPMITKMKIEEVIT